MYIGNWRVCHICHRFSYRLIKDRYESNFTHKTCFDESRDNIVKIGCRSWDTDVVVLVGALLPEDSERKVLNEGRGNRIFIMLLSQIKMSRSRKEAPIGLISVNIQKHPFRGVPEIMEQIYRRTPMPKFDINKVAIKPKNSKKIKKKYA